MGMCVWVCGWACRKGERGKSGWIEVQERGEAEEFRCRKGEGGMPLEMVFAKGRNLWVIEISIKRVVMVASKLGSKEKSDIIFSN